MTDSSNRDCGAIVITGAAGFFGWHLRCRMRALLSAKEVRPVDRETFCDDTALTTALKGADAVVHLAGANRGEPQAVHDTNVTLAERLVEALDEVGGAPQLIYANSRHQQFDTPYGTSKRRAAHLLGAWARRSGSIFTDIVFPNLFGEHGRPDYNSAVATFARDLSEGRASEVNPDGKIELLHVQAASAMLLDVLAKEQSGRVDVDGTSLTIPVVYERLQRLRTGYGSSLLPQLGDRLDLELFNTLRSVLFPGAYPVALEAHADERGVFVELARGHGQGQTSFSTTQPGVTRGGHYHFDKIERFVVLEGDGLIRVRRVLTKEVVEFPVSGARPAAVDMPTLHTHDITNVGHVPMLTAFWANDHFDPAAPDTYSEQVVEAELAGMAR